MMFGEIHQRLLAWFAAQGRDLPWRRTRDPYRILVSEVMLQQTQVDRVLPKYQAFLAQFPTIEALAHAPTAEVIRAWAGLGYNRRAVNLQRTARAVLEQYGGTFPRDVALLRQLPGIGPYTAGAVACFAFEQDVAFIDTNIRRVVQRLLSEPDQVPNEAQALALATAALPAGQGWAWNQAIMELGALVCVANTPACWRCPVQSACRDYAARRAADEQMFAVPAKTVRKPRKAAERRETYGRTEAPFAGSNRFYRGRIVDVLRNAPSGQLVALDDIGQGIKAGFDAQDRAWLRTIMAGLERDGLIVTEGDAARLP